MMIKQKTYTSGGNNQTITGANMGNHHKVDKSQGFIDEGMTLITETDSDKYLNMAAKRNRNKKKEELYPMPEDRMDRPCGGAGGFDDFVERWTE
tara:strand:+ start:134 stop:415 length:282 start_codon:yes stop_codon:yes gene_type:complete